MHTFEKISNLSVNVYEKKFYDKWEHKLLPMENSKKDSDRFVHLLTYKNL